MNRWIWGAIGRKELFMKKHVKMFVNTNLQPNVMALVKELEEKGFIVDGEIVYDDADEKAIKELFDKYDQTL